MNGKFNLFLGAGDCTLIQQRGDTRPNVAHFYGPDAVAQAIVALRSGDLGFSPSFAQVGSERVSIEELLANA